jgi:1-aminocyclopropane-1-carboxylate deaminase/D-cysteine desulfhydrase-like pyridoxal-dependent ACC family enzyme
MNKTVTIEELREKIDSFPRVRLAVLPTPLHEVPRFSAAIGGPRIFIKRDDLTGLAFGGNKTRMFEFLLAKARAEGADTVVGGAGVQSNYARQLAAACNSMGFEIYLVLRRIRGAKDNNIQGNLLLDLLAGASVHIINASTEEQRRAMYDLAEELKKKGKKPFVARMAADEDLSSDVIAYVNCFCEIVEQCKEMRIEPTHLYLSSYDSTQAGLELSINALGSSIRIVGIAPGVWESEASALISRYANQAAEKLALNCRIKREDVFNTTDYVGERYGTPTQAGIEMLKLMARTEGVFLDPVYTSKAMSALYDHVKKGEVSSKDVVIFLHTGGTPALFAYQEELGTEEMRRHLVFD